MAILIIDRDEQSAEQIRTMLEEKKVAYDHVLTRDEGMQLMRQKHYDAVVIDPAPQNEIRPFVMASRRMSLEYSYILMTSRTIDRQKALAGGCNELLPKPLDMVAVEQKVESAVRLGQITKQLADESTDFPSKEGVIAKSAFNQLFRACLDRADRYGEQSYMIFVRISNHDEIINKEGVDALNKCALALRKYLSRIRRLSDICGHTESYEYTLLLLRPAKEDEPFLAANRFAETLQEYHDLISLSQTPAEISVSLFTAPAGDVLVEHSFNKKSVSVVA